jgi:hypothetical protein
LERNVHLAAGLVSRLRESPELSAVFREQAVLTERARVDAILDRAAGRGELAGRPAVTPLFASVAGSIIHTRVLLTGEAVDAAFVGELVDHVLLPILSPRRAA